MTDRDGTDEARIRAAFQSETRRAEADLRSDPLLPRPHARGMTRSRRPRILAGLVAVAIVAILVAGAVGVVRHSPSTMSTNPSSIASSTSTKVVASPLPTATLPSDRYSDGIPRAFDGQPVLRWGDALAMRDTATDATPFLTGVWLDVPVGIFSCPKGGGTDPRAPNSWITYGGCQFQLITADAGSGSDAHQSGVDSFRFYKGTLTTGPAIMRVHLHDPRASQCGSQKPICDLVLIVDDILWTGDEFTNPHPLNVRQVIAATRQVSPNSGLLGPGQSVYGCGANVAGGLLLCPPMDTGVQWASPIAGAAVLPSIEAIARALPNAVPGVDGALASAVVWSQEGTSGRWDYRRLVVDNVVILVRTIPGTPSEADRTFLTQLVAALKAQEGGPSSTN